MTAEVSWLEAEREWRWSRSRQRSNSRAVSSSQVMDLPLPPGERPVPVALGPGTRGGRAAQAVLPSYSKDLEEAVLAFVAYKS